jgi:hypothetical protein
MLAAPITVSLLPLSESSVCDYNQYLLNRIPSPSLWQSALQIFT